MKGTGQIALLAVYGSFATATHGPPTNGPASYGSYPFAPESTTQVLNTLYPLAYKNWTDFNTNYAWPSSSWWSNHYISASNGHQYAIVSHFLVNNIGGVDSALARGSIFDLTDKTTYFSYSEIVDEPKTVTPNGILDIFVANFTYQSLTPDSYSTLRTYAKTPYYTYNLTWEATSAPLLNWGGNNWTLGTGATVEWGQPACKTQGDLTIGGGSPLTVDPAHSFTWYDRQQVSGVPRNWTWFELHFPGSDNKASIWAIDNVDLSEERFATFRTSNGTQLVPWTLVTDPNSKWVSPKSNVTYYTRWTADFGNGNQLEIASVKTDQEIFASAEVSALNAYEGFVEARGTWNGVKYDNVFGLVEQVTFSN